MTPSAVFALRARLLGRRLDELERAILGEEGKSLDWTQGAFHTEIARQRDAIVQVRKDPQREDWAAQRALDQGCRRLFQDGLAYLLAVQRPARDPAVESITAVLIASLARQCRLGATPMLVPDLAETYSEAIPIIRVRFPAAGMWDIAAAAHEFGHYAAMRVTDPETGTAPLATLVEATVAADPTDAVRRSSIVNELFADMFATYVLGPAYVMSLLFARLNLANVQEPDGLTHPSSATRADMMLKTLRRMVIEGQGLTKLIERLDDCWCALCGGTARPTQSPLDSLVSHGDLYRVLKKVAAPARYEGWQRVDTQVSFAFSHGRAPSLRGLDERDLLNGAWMALTATGDETAVQERAEELWQMRAQA